MKFCRDCNFFRCEDWGYVCILAKKDVDPVTGHEEHSRCYEERSIGGGCGPEGKNFRPSIPRQLWNFIHPSAGTEGPQS